jgi:hypothetical protein
MNQFFYESRGKEKIKDLMDEGMRSQAFHRAGAPNLASLRGLPKLVLVVIGILGLLELLVH